MLLHRLRNLARHRLRNSLVGRVLLSPAASEKNPRIEIVAATRLSEADFESRSALGQSLEAIRDDDQVSVRIFHENTRGLPAVYNSVLRSSPGIDVLVFIHDDVWIIDKNFIEKIKVAMRRFDIVGVAGNTRISRNQPAWHVRAKSGDSFIWDYGYLAGALSHGNLDTSELSVYGPTPARCQLLDGVFLACRKEALLSSNVQFDERFDFHFYDLDLCRSARRAGLWMGTWPIDLIHQSKGAVDVPHWEAAWDRYLEKWKH